MFLYSAIAAPALAGITCETSLCIDQNTRTRQTYFLKAHLYEWFLLFLSPILFSDDVTDTFFKWQRRDSNVFSDTSRKSFFDNINFAIGYLTYNRQKRCKILTFRLFRYCLKAAKEKKKSKYIVKNSYSLVYVRNRTYIKYSRFWFWTTG